MGYNDIEKQGKDPQGLILHAVINKIDQYNQQHANDTSFVPVKWTTNDFGNTNQANLQFSIGKDGAGISAAATAMQHMQDYLTYVNGNGNTSIPAVNQAKNNLEKAFGSGSVTSAQVIGKLVGEELSKAYNLNSE